MKTELKFTKEAVENLENNISDLIIAFENEHENLEVEKINVEKQLKEISNNRKVLISQKVKITFSIK